MAAPSRSADLHPPEMLHDARMASLVKLRCSADDLGVRPLWAGQVDTAATFVAVVGRL